MTNNNKTEKELQENSKEYLNFSENISKNTNSSYNETFGEHDKQSKNNVNRKKQITIGISIFLLLVIIPLSVILGKHYIVRKDNLTWLAYGMQQKLNAKQIKAIHDIKININGKQTNANIASALIKGYLDNTSIKIDGYSDRLQKKSLTKINVNKKNTNLIKGEIFTNKDVAIFKFPLVDKKNFYIDFNELNKLIYKEQENMMKKIKYENYKEVFNVGKSKYYKKIDKKIFNVFKDKLNNKFERNNDVILDLNESGKSKKIKCDELVLKLNNNDIINLYEDIIKSVKNDENLKLFIKERINKFFNIAKKNNELKLWGLKEEDIKNFNEHFDERYKNSISELEKGLKNIDKTNTCNISIAFRFDWNNNIKNIIYKGNFKIDNGAFIEVVDNYNVMNINKKVKIEEKNYTKDINILDKKNSILNTVNSNENNDKY